MGRSELWVPALLVLGAGLLLGSWPSAVLGGASTLAVLSASRGWWHFIVMLVMGCSWVVGGIVLALMRWQAGAGPGVVGAGLLVCAGVLALSETTSNPVVGVIGRAPESAGAAVRVGIGEAVRPVAETDEDGGRWSAGGADRGGLL